MANERTIKAGSDWANYWFRSVSGTTVEGDGMLSVGQPDGSTIRDGAIRFASVTSAETIQSATLHLYIGYRNNTDSSKHLKFSVYGINEDNTGNFTSDPFGRSQTSQQTDIDLTMNNVPLGAFYAISVTSIVQAIINRAGWTTGNSIGFFIRDNTSDHSAYIDAGPRDNVGQTNPSQICSLTIKENTDPDFTPDPVTVSAPTFPPSKNIGIKIAYPGYDVKTATEQQLYFTTDKRIHKITAQGKIDATGGVQYNIPHGLSYIPLAIAYVKSPSSAHRYKLPRYFPPIQQDPDADNNNGIVEVDGTNVKITVDQNSEIYYYIFLDELSA